MALRINDEAPNFTAETTHGPITFHEWIGDGWAILFSHRKDFTPMSATELGYYLADLRAECDKRYCKIIGLSVDPVDDYKSKDIEETHSHAVDYPMIGDPELRVAKLYDLMPDDLLPDDLLPDDAGTTSQGRTPDQNAAVRTVFLIGPDKKIKISLTYPMSAGRTFDEVPRVLDSIKPTTEHQVAMLANWNAGEDLIIAPIDLDEDARKKGFWDWLRELFGREEKRYESGNS